MSAVEPRRPLLQVALHPFTAAWLAVRLSDSWWEDAIAAFEAQGRMQEAQALRQDRARIQEARRQLVDRRAERAQASADGSAEVVSAEAGAGSPVMDEITTDGAATQLQCSARRVRQLLASGDLRGRQVGRSWLVDRGSVVDLLEARRGA